MIVTVKVLDETVKVSCGNGRQNFKWLGSVVQSRIKQYGVLKNKFQEDHYIVTEIRNTDGQLLNPLDLLTEHAIGDNLSCTATVVSSFPVDEWENPEMGDWVRIANVKSEIGMNWANEVQAWRESVDKVKKSSSAKADGSTETSSNMLLHRALPPNSNLIQIGFDFSQSDINSAFDLDWSVMKWDWLQPTDMQKSLLGDVMKTNYALVCNVFAHYSGVGQGNALFNYFPVDFEFV
jgi:hypothetical protein